MGFLHSLAAGFIALMSAIGGFFGFTHSAPVTTAPATTTVSVAGPVASTKGGESSPYWISLSVATSSFYHEYAGSVYYRYLDEVVYNKLLDKRSLSSREIDGFSYYDAAISAADRKSFLVSTEDNRIGKDAAHVFFEGVIIGGADPNTYELIPLEGYDSVNDRKGVNYPFAKDAYSVYCRDKRIPDADPESFQPIFSTSDVFTSEYGDWIGKRVAKDKYHVYNPEDCDVNGIQVIGADPATFAYLGGQDWFKDEGGVYQIDGQVGLLHKLDGADPATFAIMNGTWNWAKDKNGIYVYPLAKVSGANPATFTPILEDGMDTYYALDGDTLFFGGRDIGSLGDPYNVVGDIDAPTFTVLGEGYAKDKDRVFFDGFAIHDADPETFRIFPDKTSGVVDRFFAYKAYAEDKNHVYLNGNATQ